MNRTATGIKSWRLGLAAAALAVFSATAAQQPPQTPAPAPQQPSDIGARITGDPGAAPRYAVPDFVALTPNATEIGRMLGQVLWDDLFYEREFYMIARDTYKTIPVARTAQQIPFASWRELGTDGLVYGTVEQKGDQVRVEVRVFNVRTGESVLGQEFTTPARNARRVAHTIANLILDQRNVKGVALTRLAYISDRQRQSLLGTVETRDAKEIYIADYDGANQQPVTVTKQLNLGPSWSHDARSLAYTNYPPGAARTTIFIAHLLTGIRQELTKSEGNHMLPAYSPDGKRIAYVSTRNGNVDIYVANADGSNERRLTTHPDADGAPAWSPSGQQIVFTSDRASGGLARARLFTMNADGTNQQLLGIPDLEADRPTWAPLPYNEIAYTARSGPGHDIKVYDPATGQVRQITRGEGSNESPSYSPSGRHIAFQSSRGGGRFQIYTIARTGDPATLRQITREGENKMPDWSN